MARQTLREAAGAALAQAGFEADPRLRGAASRTLDRMMAVPEVAGRREAVDPHRQPPGALARRVRAVDLRAADARAHAALPQRALRGHGLLYRWLTRPLPRQEQMQVVGRKIVLLCRCW